MAWFVDGINCRRNPLLACALAVTWAIVGCSGGTSVAHPTAPAATSVQPPGSSLIDVNWGWLRSRDRQIRVHLPDVEQWQRVSRGNWFALVHNGTQAELRLRLQRASRANSPRRCLANAPEFAAFAAILPEQLLEAGTLTLPQGFVAELLVVVTERAAASARGSAILIAAKPEQCFYALFETQHIGVHFEAALAADLELIAHSVLPRIDLPRAEDRVKALALPEPRLR